jgi:hypothetical protein
LRNYQRQSCSLERKNFNIISHVQFKGHLINVSWNLLVKSQIASLILGFYFFHNVNLIFSNIKYEPIFYTLQDLSNGEKIIWFELPFLSASKQHNSSTPKVRNIVGSYLKVLKFISLYSPTLLGVCLSLRTFSNLFPFPVLLLIISPMDRVMK